MLSPAGSEQLAADDQVDFCFQLIEEFGQLEDRAILLSPTLRGQPAGLASGLVCVSGQMGFLAGAEVQLNNLVSAPY
jgi:hypothetical protein